MKIKLGKAYQKLRTDFIELNAGGKSLVTNDHEIEVEEGEESLVVGTGQMTDIILCCSTDQEIEVLDDKIILECYDGRFEIQFLETRPMNKLQERIILG